MDTVVRLSVNGVPREVDAPLDTSLLEVLRNDLGLTGAKYGCGEGQCGACTVMVGGVAVRSCVTPLSAVGSEEVETIEGLAKGGEMHAVQKAFIEHGAMQCGYCVPGMVVSAAALLRENPDATEAEIVAHMDGNVCRCCGYPEMLAAIKSVVRGGK
jgi:aerobic-type carbon monoxide dehydrogenase small subunit (CoxS/CutS family)